MTVASHGSRADRDAGCEDANPLPGRTPARGSASWSKNSGEALAQVRDSVQVKLIKQDGELYILARSGGRRDKEQAMRRRRLKKLVKRLHELRQQKLTGSTADQAGSCTNGSGAGRLSDHRHPAAGKTSRSRRRLSASS